MRRLFSALAMLIVGGLLFVCCEQKLEQIDEVSVYFVFNLPTDSGGSMTKATNAEVFGEFYKKIVSAELVAEDYDLMLTDISSGARIECKGNWNNHSMITLKTGTYKVEGTSTAKGGIIQDKCSFVFNEMIIVETSTSSVILTAEYDCYLLIFSGNEIATISNFDGKNTVPLFDFKTYKYAFVNNKLYVEDKQSSAYLSGTYSNGAEFRCYTGNLGFERGKYYVYNTITGGFTIPEMEEGGFDNNAVDLGLSVKWRSMNLGAQFETDYGGRYAWGEVTTKTSYNWNNYKWCNGSFSSMTKYCTNSSYGTVDNKVYLEDEDDAARVVLGSKWRMPTVEEAEELLTKCTWTEETVNSVKGYRVIGSNSNSIFIPLNGQHDEYGISWDGVSIMLWLNKCNGMYSGYVFKQSGVTASNDRHDGLCIRPVCD